MRRPFIWKVFGTDMYTRYRSLGNPPQLFRPLSTVFRHMQSDQLLAIVNKYMQEHPERWGDPMGEIVSNALPKECWNF